MLGYWRTFQVIVSLPGWQDHCEASNVTARLMVTLPGLKLGHCYAVKLKRVIPNFGLLNHL
jgi:hypothetical protein